MSSKKVAAAVPVAPTTFMCPDRTIPIPNNGDRTKTRFGQGSEDKQSRLKAVPTVWSFYFMVGITNSAPSLTPDGQRAVTVLVRV